jgi:cobalt-zinc-cadmium efflux system protein
VSHSHAHTHAARGSADRTGALRVALALAATYMVAEVVGGLVTGSLALLADAGHMASDVGALSLSLFAAWVAQRPADAQRTYGYYRAEILAALVHGAALVAVAFYIVLEAVERLGSPTPVWAGPMMAVAAGGLAVNGAALWVLERHRHGSLNVRGAWLHVVSDALASVAALAAGGLILAFGWTWADPAASLAISVLVLWSAWKLLGEAVGVLLEGAPGHIDVDRIRDAIRAVPGVLAVHDLHVWEIASGMVCLSCHVVAKDASPGSPLLLDVNRALERGFGIDHATIQVEPEDFEESGPCE